MNQEYVLPFSLLAFVISFLPSGTYASEEFDQAGIWLGVDVGAGNVETSSGGRDQNNSALYLGFKIHYRLDHHYLVGFELSGWTLESGDLWDPSKGEGISQAFIVAQYYPNADSGLFIKAGGGYASYWNNQPGEPGRESGSGLAFGAGYDYILQQHWALTPVVLFSSLDIDGADNNAWALGVGIAYNF